MRWGEGLATREGALEEVCCVGMEGIMYVFDRKGKEGVWCWPLGGRVKGKGRKC